LGLEVEDAKLLVQERLAEYVSLSQSGNEINLNELSAEVTDLITELDENGLPIYDQRGVKIDSVQIGINPFGVVFVAFNGDSTHG